MIQKLIQAGYGLISIQELILLFQSNLDSYQNIFKQENINTTLSTLHKLKGGLRVLQFSELIGDVEYLETAIKLEGITRNKTLVIKLIEQCYLTSNLVLSEIEALLSENRPK